MILKILQLGMILTLLCAGKGEAQPPGPSFDVAAIAVSDPQAPTGTIQWLPNGRYTAVNVLLRAVIERAYDLKNYQLLGAPDWMKSARYTINAAGSESTGEAQIKRMVQALLRDRFRLVAHLETRNLPVYALVLGKGGAKLSTAADVTKCGGQACVGIGRGNLTATGATIESFAQTLSTLLDRPVIDRTQLEGKYDLKLSYDQSTVKQPMIGLTTSDATNNPSIFTAVQEQLGLRFEAQTSPVEVLVIDSIDRPTAN